MDLTFEPDLAGLLAGWEQFSTLDDAVLTLLGAPAVGLPAASSTLTAGPMARLARFIRTQQAEKVRRTGEYARLYARLGQLRELGVLVSEEQIVDGCGAAASGVAGLSIQAIGLRATHDVAQVASSAAAWFAGASDTSRHLRVIVTGAPGADATGQTAMPRPPRAGVSVTTIGREERARLAQALIRCGIPAAVSRDALGDLSPIVDGGLMAQQLLAADSPFFFAGDVGPGGLPPMVRHPSRTGTALFTQRERREVWIGTDAPRASEASWREVLEAHERLLGRSLPAVVADFRRSSNVALDLLCSHLMTEVSHDRARIAVTYGGSCERPVSDAITRYRRADDSGTRLRIADFLRRRDPEAARSRLVGMPRDFVVSHDAPYCGRSFALDGAVGLPPILALDGPGAVLFQALVRLCAPDAYFGCVPYVGRLSNVGGAAEHPPAIQNEAFPTLTHLILASLQTDDIFPTRHGPVSLRSIGRRLQDVAALPGAELAKVLWPSLAALCGRELAEVHHLLREVGAVSDASAEALVPWRESAVAWLRSSSPTIPAAQVGVLSRIAALLEHWPDIVAASRLLRGFGGSAET